MKAVTRLQSISPLTCFLLSGSVLEILYLLICTLIPFNTTSTTHWSSSTAWPGICYGHYGLLRYAVLMHSLSVLYYFHARRYLPILYSTWTICRLHSTNHYSSSAFLSSI